MTQSGITFYTHGMERIACSTLMEHFMGKDTNEPEYVSADTVSIGGDRDAGGLVQCFSGVVSNVAIWNQALSPSTIKALAGAKNGSFQLISGYLNNPERTIIRDLDNMTGSYPTIARTTGIKGTVGNSAITPYNEMRAIQFNNEASLSNYPMVLSTMGTYLSSSRTGIDGYSYADQFNKNFVATPNITSSIKTPGKSKPFLSTQRMTPSIDQGLDLTPFDESRITLHDTPFYLTGTANHVLPGFSSRLCR